ncbi:MAG: hypothetical protein HC849_26275 [Oscillatoriales cyanobacterium RU_3_3]|nr:hypothetical protein [Microcoleus sp. SU_5_6]NJL65901.1 hypothetical protein [Microcoleus sp. SM1_3_4]NJM62900.1 hypothetical protein [Oscillatoriales cyanobacterium RU_3_3]NJR24220.1 hypothetical protein [Richelia sp. CSU_2_1]
MTDRQLLIIDDRLPITNYQLPITNYQLPITNLKSKIESVVFSEKLSFHKIRNLNDCHRYCPTQKGKSTQAFQPPPR